MQVGWFTIIFERIEHGIEEYRFDFCSSMPIVYPCELLHVEVFWIRAKLGSARGYFCNNNNAKQPWRFFKIAEESPIFYFLTRYFSEHQMPVDFDAKVSHSETGRHLFGFVLNPRLY